MLEALTRGRRTPPLTHPALVALSLRAERAHTLAMNTRIILPDLLNTIAGDLVDANVGTTKLAKVRDWLDPGYTGANLQRLINMLGNLTPGSFTPGTTLLMLPNWLAEVPTRKNAIVASNVVARLEAAMKLPGE